MRPTQAQYDEMLKALREQITINLSRGGIPGEINHLGCQFYKDAVGQVHVINFHIHEEKSE